VKGRVLCFVLPALLALNLSAAPPRPALAATLLDGALPAYAYPAYESSPNGKNLGNAPATFEIQAVPRARPAAGELITTSNGGRTWSRAALETASPDCPVDSVRPTTSEIRCGGVTWKVQPLGSGEGAQGYLFSRK
jgi:hypothetical protein